MKIIKKIFCKKNIKWFALLLILIIVICFFSFRKNIDEVKLENHNLYQYLSGVKVEYTGVVKLNKDDEVIKLSFKDVTVELDTTPIYFQDEEKVLLPKNMSVVYPTQGRQFKINYYSYVYRDVNDYYVKDRSVKRRVENAVIYDANDLYFFIDEVSVSFANNNYQLKPMSYIIVDTFNNLVYVYDKEKDEFTIFENIEDEVIISTKKYKINASLDLMYYNNKSRLLLKSIDKLANLSKNN